ncbi:expressed unknown protein [Seminavis robusta]|uniref:Uncharacterized protein n=1 Tax=Seminavis robusta TaxID=568900 RepID=A0A9N8E1B6_9STRA|nr:expressed unknown protein [Seminavis robusta]|eukprot:Sro552_g165010.1 n/a (324) ;mRNA; r:9869-10840
MSAHTMPQEPSASANDDGNQPSGPNDCRADSGEDNHKRENGAIGRFFPLHPLAALAIMPLLPTWLFLNRGYTQWFHWCFVFYMVTGGKLEWWRRFLVIQGAEISMGWYAAVVYEYVWHSRFCHILYNNMPPSMKAEMLVNGSMASGGIITNNPTAIANITLSHIIDILAHPLLTFLVYKIHRSKGGTIRSLMQWDILVSTYALSRLYSCTHLYHNQGKVGLFYYGYEVYNIDNVNAYTPAYIAEAGFYVALICYKLYHQWNMHRLRLKIRVTGSDRRRRRSMELQKLSKKRLSERKPLLMQSSSCFSTDGKQLDDDDDLERTC